MFKLLKNRISKKEEELKALKTKLKSKNNQARCMIVQVPFCKFSYLNSVPTLLRLINKQILFPIPQMFLLKQN